MANKLLLINQPRFGMTGSYNFDTEYEENPPVYEDSLGLPMNRDKFVKKDLYTSAVSSDINNAIIERNLKAQAGTSYIRIDKLYISERSGKKSGNNRCEVWMFDQESYPGFSFESAGYSSIKGELRDTTRIYRDDINQLDGGKNWGQAAGLDGQNIIQDLEQSSIAIEDFSNNHTGYNTSDSFTLRDISIHTTIIDENVYNPIYFVIRLRGDETEGAGTDVRKRVYYVYKINNLELFDYDDSGNAIPKVTYFDDTNIISEVNRTEGDGGGAGDEAPKWKINSGDFQVSINTLGSVKNDWEGEDDEVDGDDEKKYEKYFADVEPPIFFDPVFTNPINLLRIAPDRQLNGNALQELPGPNQQTYSFPDFFPTTTISVVDAVGNFEPYDLQSYYERDNQLLIRQQTSAPATIGVTIKNVSPDGTMSGPSQFYYFVIDWDDRDDEIKTLEDWQNIRPTTFLDLQELQDKNLYKLMRRSSELVSKEWTLYYDPNPYDLFPGELPFEQGEDFGGLRHSSFWDDIEYGTYETANKACQVLGHTGYDWYSQAEGGPGGATTTEPTPNLVYWDGNQWLKDPNEYEVGYYSRLDCVDLTYLGFEDEIPINTYTTPGIKTIKMIVMTYNSNPNTGEITYGRWKLITSRFYLDIPINQYPDFGELGGSDYTTIPWPYTTPVIGGVDEASNYKISVQNTLSGGNIGDTDIIDEKFLIGDLENDEVGKSIKDMDLEQVRYFNDSYDMDELLNLQNEPTLVFDEQYLEGDYLSELPSPIYFEEFDVSLDGVISQQDADIWREDFARPDVAAVIETGEANPTDEEVEQAYTETYSDIDIFGQFQLFTTNFGETYLASRYWTGELGECASGPMSWYGLTGSTDSIAEMGFDNPFNSDPPSEVCSWFFAEQCPEFDSCEAVKNDMCDSGQSDSAWYGFDCFPTIPSLEEFTEQYLEENPLVFDPPPTPSIGTEDIITYDTFDDPSWTGGNFQFILWEDGGSQFIQNVVEGWNLVNQGPDEGNQMALHHSDNSIEIFNTTSNNLYILTKDDVQVIKGRTYQVLIEISGENRVFESYGATYQPGILETLGGANQVELQDGFNAFEWTPTWNDDDSTKKIVVRRGTWTGGFQSFKVVSINIIGDVFPEPDFNQYTNYEYFESAQSEFNPYYDTSYWDGDVNKFPMESSVGQIFISDNQDLELKQSCKLEINAGELNRKSIYDSSGNSNKGLLIGDYKVKKNRKGEPMRRDSFIKVPKKASNRDGAL